MVVEIGIRMIGALMTEVPSFFLPILLDFTNFYSNSFSDDRRDNRGYGFGGGRDNNDRDRGGSSDNYNRNDRDRGSGFDRYDRNDRGGGFDNYNRNAVDDSRYH